MARINDLVNYRSLKFAESLKEHTTFNTGGPAEYFSIPKDESELKDLLSFARECKLPVFVLGAGSNLLIRDRGVRGLVVKLSAAYFKKAVFKKNTLSAGAGCFLPQLINKSRNYSLSGLEFLAGIPGTVGGALAMNAGIAKKNIADCVEDITVMDYNGTSKILKWDKIKFSYRSSDLSKYIILKAVFKLTVKSKDEIQRKIRDYILERNIKQDINFPNAGCIFKNPAVNSGMGSVMSAGKLIDLCGLKGKRIGGASVSLKHANFIVNTGDAKTEDILGLVELIKKQVKKKFNINLEPEVKIWG
ncbi:MAG: UDP-N-acetylmuramate dehydrogenase [Candidatus Omnitrophota bacterium]